MDADLAANADDGDGFDVCFGHFVCWRGWLWSTFIGTVDMTSALNELLKFFRLFWVMAIGKDWVFSRKHRADFIKMPFSILYYRLQ